MDTSPHILEIAHSQGIKAGLDANVSPYDCPWPPELYEETYGWLAGFSVARLARQATERTAGGMTVLHK